MEKPIPNFPEYSAHKDGFVVSYKNKKRVVLVGGGTKAGYPQVSLRHDGVQVQPLVHRLIAMAFIENPNNYTVVNHIDGNKRNNSVPNLEWVSAAMNMQHSVKTGLWTPPTPEHYARIRRLAGESRALFTAAQAKEIAGTRGLTISAIAQKFGCSRDTIKRIRSGKTTNFKRES